MPLDRAGGAWWQPLVPPTTSMLATLTAALITNPADALRVKMQVAVRAHVGAGASAAGAAAATPAPGLVHTALAIIRQDGWRGLQRGVAATAMYQVAMNVVRLGTYDAVRDALARTLDSVSPPSSASSSSVRGVAVATLAGMATGAAGASLSLPFFMLKVRSQGLSAHYGDSVGGVLGELRRVARADGFGALYRGGRIAVTRTSLASGAQFFGYEAVRRLVCERLGWKHDLRTRVVASFGASIMATAVLNPLDLVYAHVVTNSPVAQQVAAAAHSGRATLLPVAAALVRANGVRVLGRGFTAGYLRSGPNTIITFVVWQQLRALFE